jgi:hypothetical protein
MVSVSLWWPFFGFVCGGSGIVLANRHVEYDGRWQRLADVISTLVPALIVGFMAALFSAMAANFFKGRSFLFRSILIGTMNLIFLVAPELGYMVLAGEAIDPNRKKEKALLSKRNFD